MYGVQHPGFVGNEGQTLCLGFQAPANPITASPWVAQIPNLSLLEMPIFSPHSLAQRGATHCDPSEVSGIPWNIATGHASLSNVVIEKTKTPALEGGPCRRCHPQKEVRIGKGTQDGACLCAGLDSWGTTFGGCLRGNVGAQSKSIPQLGI